MALLTDSGPQAHTHSAETLVPDQSRAERTRSWEVADFPVPQGREEDWRFTPVGRLAELFTDEGGSATLSVEHDLPQGVTRTQVPAAEARTAGVPLPADRAAAVAASGDSVVVIDVPAEAELAEPVRVHLTGEAGEPVRAHHLVRVGAFAKATLVVEHSGTAEYTELLSVIAGDSAQLTIVSLQDWEDDAVHLGQHDVVVGRDASVRHIAITIGGGIVRLNTNASYAGPGGSFEAFGVYFADAGQHLEHRLFVDHEAPHCSSNVEYKGALQGETAHTVWVGDVLIRAAAEGTETYELNRNLVLTDGARADSVPNLEIETGEIVGAGHASTTGRFDDQQLFYLQSRGVPEDEARRLVVRGFFNSIVQRIGDADISERIMRAIDVELEGGGA
ncbi:Fe-S cluster assembly protein SufD [Janibacter hoylei]|uniref:Fe-S cluster assembly protein SufD n=1 Tax=Janibacter hoylei TaxID=364298 RepID=UPI0021A8AB2D|nr:Fe-S cluster assembly protein SufD [Janibacter hoylei]MCT1618344.1 Fe-S cluster assembly protein SufD [Janibacter hoylei]MCT2293269.1 Fe-S cluster assembly protein SufD [Janibacter hoylei]MCW4600521.1 Fe-S cluster assembly protein SufD [Janibacter hoylei]